jgi:hypothetical protein
MIYLWAIVVAVVIASGFVYGVIQMRKRVQERILQAVSKQDGPEAAKAMEDHLKGEW